MAKAPKKAARLKPAKPRVGWQRVQLYQLHITLVDSEPSIWRQILVRADLLLSDLHHAMQVMFGWQDAHLHQWIVPSEGTLTDKALRAATRYALPEMHLENTKDAEWTSLNEVLREPKQSIIYEYDLGDCWRHALTLEAVCDFDKKTIVKILDGKRAAPPEDSGGVYGFPELLASARNRKHPDHAHFKAWLAGWDADAFDIDALNAALSKSFKA